MTTEEKIKSQIADNQILLYMKGSPEQPQCGFSQRATQILMACGKEFSFVDILLLTFINIITFSTTTTTYIYIDVVDLWIKKLRYG